MTYPARLGIFLGKTVEWRTHAGRRRVVRRGVVVVEALPGVHHFSELLPPDVTGGNRSFNPAEGWKDGIIVRVTDRHGKDRYYAPLRRWLRIVDAGEPTGEEVADA